MLKPAEPGPSFASSFLRGSFKGAAESGGCGWESREAATEGPASSGGSSHTGEIGRRWV